MRGGRMGHLDFVAAVDNCGYSLFGIQAQNLAQIGGAVAEDRKKGPHLLFQESDDQCLRQCQLHDLWQCATVECI